MSSAPRGSRDTGMRGVVVGQEPACGEDRGFPDDASDGLRAEFACYGGPHDVHGTTWLTWAELDAADRQETDATGSPRRRRAVAPGGQHHDRAFRQGDLRPLDLPRRIPGRARSERAAFVRRRRRRRLGRPAALLDVRDAGAAPGRARPAGDGRRLHHGPHHVRPRTRRVGPPVEGLAGRQSPRTTHPSSSSPITRATRSRWTAAPRSTSSPTASSPRSVGPARPPETATCRSAAARGPSLDLELVETRAADAVTHVTYRVLS